jgi:hypothetical protein
MRAAAYWAASSPKIRVLVEDTYFAGLRKAGVPDK